MGIVKLGEKFINLDHVAGVIDGEVALCSGSILDLTYSEVEALKSFLERTCELRLEVNNGQPDPNRGA
jgi:hypothetical protein